jgi:SAM-dependent methyltransferase
VWQPKEEASTDEVRKPSTLDRIRARLWTLVDPQWRKELAGERTVFTSLERLGELERFRDGRILEIGPKHGQDSRLLAGLRPAELVLVDLPQKREVVAAWLPSVPGARYVEGNVLYLEPHELANLGRFDLIFCLGVLYHNVEQIRLLRRLYELTAKDGLVVIESATTRDRRLASRNVVEIHWPTQYGGQRTMTHLPSRRAIVSWMEMVGFSHVRVVSAYSRPVRWQRAIVLGRRSSDDTPYLNYGSYPAGTAR